MMTTTETDLSVYTHKLKGCGDYVVVVVYLECPPCELERILGY